VPIPPDIKPENLTLVNKTSIVDSVPAFNKSDKVQLEQVFMRTLTKTEAHELKAYRGEASGSAESVGRGLRKSVCR
jgi:hypothetical protein